MTAVYPGTFDPFTLGHRDIAERASKVFDNVIIAVAADTGKRCEQLAARVKIAELSVADIKNARVQSFSGLLTDFLHKCGDCVIVRGLRSSVDFESERNLDGVYKSLSVKDGVFFMSSPQFMHVSSTVVRQLCEIGASIKDYVCGEAIDCVRENYKNRRR